VQVQLSPRAFVIILNTMTTQRDLQPFGPRQGTSTENTSERSTTPPLTIQQQLAALRTEISTLKQLQSGAHDLKFTWENIPNYDPSVSYISLNRWIRLVEEKAYFSRWDDVATTQFVISKLDGRAREWYLGSEIAYKNWNELKAALRSIFDLDPSATGVLFREAALHSSNQHRTLVDYFHTKLNQLRKLNWQIPEQDKINIIVHNITDSGTRQMTLANNPRNLDDLLTHFRSCDQNPSSDAKL
jgi:hypothetical protein